jgi:hypothetical protein
VLLSVELGSGSSVTGPPSNAPRSRPLPARDRLGGGGGGVAADTLPSLSFTRREGASTLLRLAGRLVVARTDALRAGGGGGGEILALVVLGGGAVAAAGRGVGLRETGPGLADTVSADASNGAGLWNGACSPSEAAGLVVALAVVGARPTKLAADDEVKDGREAWLGRRGGGGAGACMFTRRLDERDLVESCDDRRINEGSSLKVGTAGVDVFGVAERLLSVRE